LPWVTQDRLWQLANGITVDTFVLDAETTVRNHDNRYKIVAAQVA